MAEPDKNHKSDIEGTPTSPLSNPERRHEHKTMEIDTNSKRETQGSTISRLFKPKGHRKAASLKALRSEDENSQLETNPECDPQLRKKDSGLQDIPSSYQNEDSYNPSSNTSKPSFFSRLGFKWFSKGKPQILQEDDSQDVSKRSGKPANSQKTKLEGVYDTEREFMESVMTEKNVMDSYRVEPESERKVQSKGLVHSDSIRNSRGIFFKVVIALVITLLVGGLIIGGIYIKKNSNSNPPLKSAAAASQSTVSFTQFGQFSKAAESFKADEIVKVPSGVTTSTSTANSESTEKESIFKDHTVFFNGMQEIVEKRAIDTNFVVRGKRRLQDGTPNAIPETRTETSQSSEVYKMVTFKNADGSASSIISFEGKIENGNVLLLGTNELVQLQDVIAKYPELTATTAPSGGARLLQSSNSKKLRKLTEVDTSFLDASFTIEAAVKPECYKPMVLINYNAAYEVATVKLAAIFYDDIIDNMLDIVQTLNPRASRQYYQDNDTKEEVLTDKDHVLIKANNMKTEYDQFGNQKQFTNYEQSSIYNPQGQLLSQIKNVTSQLPTDSNPGEIASINTFIQRDTNFGRLSEESVTFLTRLFDLQCRQNFCIEKSLADFVSGITLYLDQSKEYKLISSTLNTETAPVIAPLPPIGTPEITPFAITLFDVTTMGLRCFGFYEVKAVGNDFSAKFTLNIGGESHVMFEKTGNLDYLANINKVRKIFCGIMLKFDKIKTYSKDKFKAITTILTAYKAEFDSIVKQSILDVKNFNIRTELPDYILFNMVGDDLSSILNGFKNQIGAEFDLIYGQFQDEIIEIREFMVTPILHDLSNKLDILTEMEIYLNSNANHNIATSYVQAFTELADVLNCDMHTKLLDYNLQRFNDNSDQKKELFNKIISNLIEQIETLGNANLQNEAVRCKAKLALRTFFSENYLRYIGTTIKEFNNEITKHFAFGSLFKDKICQDISNTALRIKTIFDSNANTNAIEGDLPSLQAFLDDAQTGVKIYEDYNYHNTALISLERTFRANNYAMMQSYFLKFSEKFKILDDSLDKSKNKILGLLYNIDKKYTDSFAKLEAAVLTQILEFWNQVQVLFTSFSSYLNVKQNIILMQDVTCPLNYVEHDLTNLKVLQDELNDIINYEFHNTLEGFKSDYLTIFDGFNNLKPDIANIVSVYDSFKDLDKIYIDIKVTGCEWVKLCSVGVLMDTSISSIVDMTKLVLLNIPHQISYNINDHITNQITGRIDSFFTISLKKLTKDTIELRSATFLTELNGEVPKIEGSNLLFKDTNRYEKIVRAKGLSNDLYTRFIFEMDISVFLTYSLDLLTAKAGIDTNINVNAQVTSSPTNRIAGIEAIYMGPLVDGRVIYGYLATGVPILSKGNFGNIDLNLFKTTSGVRKWDVKTTYSCEPSSVTTPPATSDLFRFMENIFNVTNTESPQQSCDLCTPKMTYAFSNPNYIDTPIVNEGYEFKKTF